MKQANSIRKCSTIVVMLFLACALIISALCLNMAPANAAEASDYTNWSSPLAISNSQFAGSGDGISSPANWSGEVIGDADLHVVHGVMNLDKYSTNRDDYELTQFAAYKTATPSSPFGLNTSNPGQDLYFPGTNRSVLLINAGTTPAAYGYTSDAVTLNPNSYYRFTVWVKSGELSANGGASFVLKGVDDEPIGFTDINTTDNPQGFVSDKMMGWYDYNIYVETAAFGTSSATVALQLGDENEGGYTKGYAMFDNVNGVEMSAEAFAKVVESPRSKIYKFNESSLVNGGDFNDATKLSGIDNSGVKTAIISELTENNNYGVEAQFASPYYENDNKVFVVSTYNVADDTFGSGYGGTSLDLGTIERYKNYRVSVWYYSESVENGNGVNVSLKYKSVNHVDGEDEDANYTVESATSLLMSGANYNHKGWHEASLYIKGSYFTDYVGKLELALGTKSAPAKGVVMFDEVRVQELTATEYADNSSSGSKVIDLNSAISIGTGVANGSFDTVGTYTQELKYEGGKLVNPLTPADWTFYTTDTVATNGYSNNAVSTDNAVYGLIPVEDMIAAGHDADKKYGNVLKMSSSTATAMSYRSGEFKATANSYNELTVKLNAEDLGGYGANLVLKTGDKVIASIEKITESGTYTFYVKGGAADATLAVELWLGLNDRDGANATKLATGTVYFTDASYKTDSTQAVFDDAAAAYATQRSIKGVREGISNAAVDLSSNFTLYDSYTEGTVKYPYNWTMSKGDGAVRYGLFDANSREDSVIYENYTNGGKKYAFMLQNIEPTYSTASMTNTFTLKASTYYKLTVSAKVSFPAEYYEVEEGTAYFDKEDAIGAFIKLSNGEDYKFNVTKTYKQDDTTFDYEAFETFTFYIKSSEAETTTSVTVGLGGTQSNQLVAGQIFINDIAIEESSDVAYDTVTAGVKEGVNLINDTTMRVDLTAATEEEEPETPEQEVVDDKSLEWWLVPSILLAVAVVLAIVGSLVRKWIENRPKKAKGDKTPAYDRRRLVTKKAGKSADKKAKKTDEAKEVEDDFDSFSDDKDADDKAEVIEVESEEVEPDAEPAEKAEEAEAPAEATEEVTEATETAEAGDTAEAVEAEAVESEAETTEEVTEAKPEAEKPEEKKADKKKAAKSDKPATKFVDGFDD